MDTISERKFTKLLQQNLGTDWERALKVFRNCGPNLSFDVANVLFHAHERGKVGEVLAALERHYETHLQFQHPKLRGQVRDNLLNVNPTEIIFLNEILAGILGLHISTAAG